MIDQLNYYCCNDIITTIWCIFFFFSDFKNYFVITNICYEVMFGTILAPTILAVSLDQWHAECCETAVAENTSVYLKKKRLTRFAKYTFFLKCQPLFLFKSKTANILGKLGLKIQIYFFFPQGIPYITIEFKSNWRINLESQVESYR